MIRMARMGVLVALALLCGAPAVWAQGDRDQALKRQVEQRFEVLPLRDGLALRPKAAASGVRSVEIAGGTIALDGQPATGAELRQKLGADADLVLQLSYLADAARRDLFLPSGTSTTPATPGTPPPPSSPPAPAAPSIAPEPPPLPPSPPRPRERRDRRNGDRVRIGGSVTVSEGELVEGDVVAVGGPVSVYGRVSGDVVSVGGPVTLGAAAVVDGDVTAVGGPLTRDPGAVVHGKAQEVNIGNLDLSRWTWSRNPVGSWWRSMLGSAFAFVGTLVRIAVLCLFVSLVVLFGREYMERVGNVAASVPLKAGGVGVLAQVLFLPLLVITIVVLVMTIIGIPLLLLLPFAVLGIALVSLVGFTAVAHYVGTLAASRFGWADRNPYLLANVGVLMIMAPVLLSRLASLGGAFLFPLALTLGIAGFVLEYLAWTVGFGAVALTRFGRRNDVQVPPIPEGS
ncbi:MAG: polymer-forming cytoskeletal protein [Acidobacteria bacterium]|nr:polymer-forming cytoskeletal protein [Acidobacteriota bacterium]